MPSRIVCRIPLIRLPDSKGRISLGSSLMKAIGVGDPDVVGFIATAYANGELRLAPIHASTQAKKGGSQ